MTGRLWHRIKCSVTVVLTDSKSASFQTPWLGMERVSSGKLKSFSHDVGDAADDLHVKI